MMMLLLGFTSLPMKDDSFKQALKFVREIRTRFQGDDLHVFESFVEMLNMYSEGNKSIDEVCQEVVALFQGHEDLIRMLSEYLNRPIDLSGSTSTRDN